MSQLLTGQKRIVRRPVGLADGQGDDPGTGVLFVNGSQGGAGSTAPVDTATTVSTAFHRIAGTNGRFVYHLNAGPPDSFTTTPSSTSASPASPSSTARPPSTRATSPRAPCGPRHEPRILEHEGMRGASLSNAILLDLG